MRNWKTTAFGLATAFFAWVVFDPELFRSAPWIISLSKFAMVGGLAGLGLAAKDHNVTGGGK